MIRRIIPAFLAPALLIALPLMLQPENAVTAYSGETSDQLVILTPHPESIRYEFGRAFRKHYREKTGRDIVLDFRSIGGTSDITRYIDDRFTAEFRLAWEASGHDFTEESRNNFKTDAPSAERDFFINSELGIGADIFFGGGTYEHSKFAKTGYAVDGGVQTRHPEYFAQIPREFAGEVIYDPQGRYYGCCLSSFGIGVNPDRFSDSGLEQAKTWTDLAKEALFDKIAMADPTKSGSIMKCYEMILQQAMAELGPAKGWEEGLLRIKLIASNSRYFTDSAGKLVRDVSAGNIMAGLCIDFYGFSEEEWTRKTTGSARLIFHMPQNGSAVTSDPVQMLRGAPNRKQAEMFLDFLISPDGQRLWIQKEGTPGGPEKYALLRTSVRRDANILSPREYLSLPDYDPYALAGKFRYHGEWTGKYFSLLRILIKCIALDPMDELRAARAAMIRTGGDAANPEAMAELAAVPVTYAEAKEAAAALSGDAAAVARLRREWTEFALEHYRRAQEKCEEKAGGRK